MIKIMHTVVSHGYFILIGQSLSINICWNYPWQHWVAMSPNMFSPGSKNGFALAILENNCEFLNILLSCTELGKPTKTSMYFILWSHIASSVPD